MNWRGALLVGVGVHTALLGSLAALPNERQSEILEIGAEQSVEVVSIVRLSVTTPAAQAPEPQAQATEPPPPPPPPPAPAPPPPKTSAPVKPDAPTPEARLSLKPDIETPVVEPTPEPSQEPAPTSEPSPISMTSPEPPAPQPSQSPAAAPAPAPVQLAAATTTHASDTRGASHGAPANQPLSKRARKAQQRYLGELMGWLAQHRVYPPELKKKKIEGVVKVRFAFEKSGEVTSISIAESSGNTLLDEAAVDVLRRAAPLPVIPDILGRDRLTITLPIEYSLITE